MNTIHNRLPNYLNDLQNAESFYLRDFLPRDSQPWHKLRGKQGVYLIQHPETCAPIYVGRTNGETAEAGLADRIWDHANGNTTPVKNLRAKRNEPHLDATYLRDYKVRAIEVNPKALRDLVEAYCIHELKPEANITEDRQRIVVEDQTVLIVAEPEPGS